MRKKITIEGMMCEGCSGRVTNLLNAISGVSAEDVNHDTGLAIVEVPDSVDDKKLSDVIENAGYKVVAIEAA